MRILHSLGQPDLLLDPGGILEHIRDVHPLLFCHILAGGVWGGGYGLMDPEPYERPVDLEPYGSKVQ